MLKVWHNGWDHYIAHSSREAADFQEKRTGEQAFARVPGTGEETNFERVSYWKVIVIHRDEDRLDKPQRLWAWVWILKNGPGFLANTAY